MTVDEASLLQLKSLWPDVSAPFSRIIPDGCVLARTTDDWRPGMRVRTIELLRGEDCPALYELLEEACEDAERRGWTLLDDEASAYELEGVILRLAVSKKRPVLSASFSQPWPKDSGAPVETSEAFQKMVREALGLGGDPSRVTKEIVVDPFDLSRIDVLHETVELPLDRELIKRFPRIGFSYDPNVEAWTMGSIFGDYELAARVREGFEKVVVEVTKKRLRN